LLQGKKSLHMDNHACEMGGYTLVFTCAQR
jgi:hypothetical protein